MNVGAQQLAAHHALVAHIHFFAIAPVNQHIAIGRQFKRQWRLKWQLIVQRNGGLVFIELQEVEHTFSIDD